MIHGSIQNYKRLVIHVINAINMSSTCQHKRQHFSTSAFANTMPTQCQHIEGLSTYHY